MLGADFIGIHCARCKSQLTIPAHYEGRAWYHARCWQEGEHQLAAATKISDAVRRMYELFPPLVPSPKHGSLTPP
jgi:hypothetical protein